MSALPFPKGQNPLMATVAVPPQSSGFDFNNIGQRLSDFADAIQPLAQQNIARQDEELMRKTFAANPQFAQQLYGTMENQKAGLREQKRLELSERNQKRAEERLRSLQEFSESIVERDPENPLAQYAAVTGDPTLYLKAKTGKTADPAAVREYEFFQGLDETAKEDFMRLKRAQQIKDLGGSLITFGADGQVKDEIEKTLAPKDRPDVKAEQEQAVQDVQLEMEPKKEAAKKEAVFMQEGKQALIKSQRSLASKELKEEFLQTKIDSIQERANPWNTGFTGSLASAVKGTEAHDLKADVETLLANAGFDTLQDMRDNSPTGGALGQVSEKEIGLLQAAHQNLMQSQSYEQFQRNLKAFQEQRVRSLQNVREAYEQDYKRFGGADDSNLPTPDETFGTTKTAPKAKTGVRRYNRETGKFE